MDPNVKRYLCLKMQNGKSRLKLTNIANSWLNTKPIEAVALNTRLSIIFIIGDALIKLRILLILQNEFHTNSYTKGAIRHTVWSAVDSTLRNCNLTAINKVSFSLNSLQSVLIITL